MSTIPPKPAPGASGASGASGAPRFPSSWIQIRDTNCAAAMCSVGAEFLDPKSPADSFVENGVSFSVWKFKSSKVAAECHKLWQLPLDELLTKHPEHPVAYMRAYHYSKNRLKDWLEASTINPRHIIRRNGRIYLVPESEIKEQR